MGKKKKRKISSNRSNKYCYYLACFTLVFLLLLCIFFGYSKFFRSEGSSVIPQKLHVEYPEIKDDTIQILSFGVRSHPDTEGLRLTRDFLKNRLESLNYEVRTQESIQHTPFFGDVKFVNILGFFTNNPNSDDYVVLSAHYDSKYFKDIEFLGATDSVVPVAMVLHLAQELREFGENVMVIFFDGEEAFDRWTFTDSIYGARSLAKEWEETNFLDEVHITVFLLLDLIGGKNPKFAKFQKLDQANSVSSKYYDLMCQSEYDVFGGMRYFLKRMSRNMIGDDHYPFVHFGFPIVHLISHPFPKVWHTVNDNFENLDWESVYNVQTVILDFFENKI